MNLEPLFAQTGNNSPASGLLLQGYNEVYLRGSQPHIHWRALVRALWNSSPEQLQENQEKGRRMRYEDGATYNPFAQSEEQGSPWTLDMIPLPLTAGLWNKLENGLIQRARLFERLLADVYGPQELLKSGALPAEFLYANPRFLRASHNCAPAGGRYLQFLAADIYRDINGQFRVLFDYSASPRGLGYALENRIVTSRVFPELFQQSLVRRLAPFFQTMHNALVQRIESWREDPTIILLSPGPDNPYYFEQAFLSRYLGYPLVEGQDLTVRNGKLFLKKLAGLEPIDAIFKQISDEDSDPFAFCRATATGVAGLIQVMREQNIELLNPIGSGFLETPALRTLLPELCQQLLGEPLQLPGHPCWWGGEPTFREHILQHPEQFRFVPALARQLPPPPDLGSAVQANPAAWLAEDAFVPSLAPVWKDNAITNEHLLIRVFLCATEEGFAVLPGGLAITAPAAEQLLTEVPDFQNSKDLWVFSDRPVEHFSLMKSLNTIEEFRRGSDLPSRIADHLLWLGRYMERAEGLVRLLRSVLSRLSGEASPEEMPELLLLISLLRAKGVLPQPAEGQDQQLPPTMELEQQLHEALYQKGNSETVASILQRVQESVRTVRDRISRDSWRAINRLEALTSTPQGSDPLDTLDSLLFTLNAFSGMAMESITRGLGWRFMDMGRRMERAMHQIDLIRFSLPHLCLNSRSTLTALLEVSDSIMTYRARYRTAFQLAPALDLLLMDETNPKSLAFQFAQLAEHVDQLPRQSDRRFATAEERLVLEMLTDTRLLDLRHISCAHGKAENKSSLTEFLDNMEHCLFDLSTHINAQYLTRVKATPHFSSRNEEPLP